MFDASDTSKESDWKKRTAEETATFLIQNFGPDECDRLALIACMTNVAIYERRQNEALFWSIVLARRERRALEEAIRRELQALLDESRNWDT
jgi:hypothetical protein